MDRTTFTHEEFANARNGELTEFPKFKYHPEKEPVVVANEEEDKALGDGWSNTPEAA